jgi:hypothetical protein
MSIDDASLGKLIDRLVGAEFTRDVDVDLLRNGYRLLSSIKGDFKSMLGDPSRTRECDVTREKVSRLSNAIELHLHNRTSALTKAYRNGTGRVGKPRKRRVHRLKVLKESVA